MVATVPEFSVRLDSPLASKVTQQLQGTGHLRLRKVEVEEDQGHVTLRGRVPTYYLKQLAQTVAVSVGGVGGIRNELTVEFAG